MFKPVCSQPGDVLELAGLFKQHLELPYRAPKAGLLQSVSSSVATTQHTDCDLLGRVTSSTHISRE